MSYDPEQEEPTMVSFDRLRRLMVLAIQLAAYPPAKFKKHAYQTSVPLHVIEELRVELTGLGVDWRSVNERRHD